MYNTMFEGIITSVAAGVVTKKVKGVKTKEGVYRVKIESSDIDYESMAEFQPSISSTLLNIQPMPFKSVNFGDQTIMNLDLYLYGLDEEDDAERGVYTELDGEPDAKFKSVKIKNLTVKNNNNIPVYVLTIEIPMGSDPKFLFAHIKSKVNVKFDKA